MADWLSPRRRSGPRSTSGAKVRVIAANDRHVDFEPVKEPGNTKRLSRPKFLTTYRPAPK